MSIDSSTRIGSYSETMKLVEDALDNRKSNSKNYLFKPLSFGDQPNINPNLNAPQSKRDKSSSNDNRIDTTSASITTTDNVVTKNKSKNQLKKEQKAQKQQEYREMVARGEIPYPKKERAQKKPSKCDSVSNNNNSQSKKGSERNLESNIVESRTGNTKNNKIASNSTTRSVREAKKDAVKREMSDNIKNEQNILPDPNNSSNPSVSNRVPKNDPLALKGSSDISTRPGRASNSTQLTPQYDLPKQLVKSKKKSVIAPKPTEKKVELFSHLPQFNRIKDINISKGILTKNPPANIPPEIVTLTMKYSSHSIQGATPRCIAMLETFKVVLKNYVHDSPRPFGIDFEKAIEPMIQLISDCRPLAIGMGNAIRRIKAYCYETLSLSDEDAQKHLLEKIDSYLNQYILEPIERISSYVSKIIAKNILGNENIMTFAYSSVVFASLKYAHSIGLKFRVVVVDSGPRFEGCKMLKDLVELGISCDYILISSLSYVLKTVKLLLVGAHALLSNGQTYSRAGTSIVCMMAHAFNVPSIVCCETYKFTERIQLDSICRNELDDPDLLLNSHPSQSNLTSSWEGPGTSPRLLNLLYDVTPSEFITSIVTEYEMIPPTSVPVVIRQNSIY